MCNCKNKVQKTTGVKAVTKTTAPTTPAKSVSKTGSSKRPAKRPSSSMQRVVIRRPL